MNVSDIDLGFRPRHLVPWLGEDQGKIHEARPKVEDEVHVITCPPPGVETGPPPRRPPAGPYFLASFAAEPAMTASPTPGFLTARRRKRGFEVEDSRNTPKGVESFGKVVVPRIPSMREVIARLDASLNYPKLPEWYRRRWDALG